MGRDMKPAGSASPAGFKLKTSAIAIKRCLNSSIMIFYMRTYYVC